MRTDLVSVETGASTMPTMLIKRHGVGIIVTFEFDGEIVEGDSFWLLCIATRFFNFTDRSVVHERKILHLTGKINKKHAVSFVTKPRVQSQDFPEKNLRTAKTSPF